MNFNEIDIKQLNIICDGWWFFDLPKEQIHISKTLLYCLDIKHNSNLFTVNQFLSLLDIESHSDFLACINKYKVQKTQRIINLILHFNIENIHKWFLSKYTEFSDNTYLNILTDITEIKHHEKALYEMAFYDTVSGVYSRSAFMVFLEKAFTNFINKKSRLAVFFLDIDNLKQINDTYGHVIGDKVINRISCKIKSLSRESDILGRLGGDEFGIIINNFYKETHLQTIAKRYIDGVRNIKIDGLPLNISCSIGISISNSNTNTIEQLLHYADLAMYQAKLNQKGSYKLYK